MTVSLPAEVIDEAERLTKSLKLKSRSAIVEKALRLLNRELRRQELAREYEAYLANETPADRKEIDAMVRAARRSRAKIPFDGPGIHAIATGCSPCPAPPW